MKLRLLGTLMVGPAILCGQSQPATDVKEKTENADRAEAYYQYALAYMYAQLGGHSSEDQKKAIESYKRAVKADPNVPPIPSFEPYLRAPVTLPFRPNVGSPPQHDEPAK
jgi:tetratricopeptide (TPR) repeat protein